MNGDPQTVYFKAIRSSDVSWRRGLVHREDDRMRMDIYEATQAEAMTDAIELDLRG